MSEIENTLYVEIEQKYKANHINMKDFIELMKSFSPYKKKTVSGPDTYYEQNGAVLRWRSSKDKNELTVKKRHSTTNTLLRTEIDLNINNNNVKTVIKFIKSLGYTKAFRIYKDCQIFWLKDENGLASIVLYTVLSKKHKPKTFIEIEADKGQPFKQSKSLIRYWEQKLGLTAGHRIAKSLYEIYSGKTTQMEDLD